MERLIILFFIVGFFWGCNKDDERRMKPTLSGFEFSECGGFKSRTIIPANEETEKLIIKAEADGYYKFDHTNVSFNCCLPAGLSANLTLSDDTLYLNEWETEQGNCRCMCKYDLTSEIKNLENGNYVLCLMKDSITRGTIKLHFTNDMYEEIVISELFE